MPPLKQLNKELEQLIEQALTRAIDGGDLPDFKIPCIPVSPPKREGQGDLAYPGMGLAKLARKNPLEIAQLISAKLPEADFIDRIEVAPPGFINCFLSEAYLKRQVDRIIEEGTTSFNLTLVRARGRRSSSSAPTPADPLPLGIRATLL